MIGQPAVARELTLDTACFGVIQIFRDLHVIQAGHQAKIAYSIGVSRGA